MCLLWKLVSHFDQEIYPTNVKTIRSITVYVFFLETSLLHSLHKDTSVFIRIFTKSTNNQTDRQTTRLQKLLRAAKKRYFKLGINISHWIGPYAREKTRAAPRTSSLFLSECPFVLRWVNHAAKPKRLGVTPPVIILTRLHGLRTF